MKIVVIADTHLPRGSRRLPELLLEHLEAADLVLHAGDFVSAALFEELRAYSRVEAVFGNQDDGDLRTLLPERQVVRAGEARIGLVHDAGPRRRREERLLAAFPSCHAVVYGHTHMPQIERRSGVWILNPGSPTERRRAARRSFLTLDVSGVSLEPRLVVTT